MIRLNAKTLQAIKKDQVLYGMVAKELNVGLPSAIRILSVNDARLTQMGVLKIISNHIHTPIEELITESK